MWSGVDDTVSTDSYAELKAPASAPGFFFFCVIVGEE
jgi:hypothetical protein